MSRPSSPVFVPLTGNGWRSFVAAGVAVGPALVMLPPADLDVVPDKRIEDIEAELAANPRARSARLRAAIRTEAPAWGAIGGKRS